MKESFHNLPLFTGGRKTLPPVNKISFTSNKSHSEDNLFSKKEIENEQKIKNEIFYCDKISLPEVEKEVNKVSIEEITLDKKISKTIDKYRFKSPFLKI